MSMREQSFMSSAKSTRDPSYMTQNKSMRDPSYMTQNKSMRDPSYMTQNQSMRETNASFATQNRDPSFMSKVSAMGGRPTYNAGSGPQGTVGDEVNHYFKNLYVPGVGYGPIAGLVSVTASTCIFLICALGTPWGAWQNKVVNSNGDTVGAASDTYTLFDGLTDVSAGCMLAAFLMVLGSTLTLNWASKNKHIQKIPQHVYGGTTSALCFGAFLIVVALLASWFAGGEDTVCQNAVSEEAAFKRYITCTKYGWGSAFACVALLMMLFSAYLVNAYNRRLHAPKGSRMTNMTRGTTSMASYSGAPSMRSQQPSMAPSMRSQQPSMASQKPSMRTQQPSMASYKPSMRSQMPSTSSSWTQSQV